MKSARVFDFQKKNVIRRTEILNDGYFFGLWDCVKITDVTHKYAGLTGTDCYLIILFISSLSFSSLLFSSPFLSVHSFKKKSDIVSGFAAWTHYHPPSFPFLSHTHSFKVTHTPFYFLSITLHHSPSLFFTISHSTGVVVRIDDRIAGHPLFEIKLDALPSVITYVQMQNDVLNHYNSTVAPLQAILMKPFLRISDVNREFAVYGLHPSDTFHCRRNVTAAWVIQRGKENWWTSWEYNIATVTVDCMTELRLLSLSLTTLLL